MLTPSTRGVASKTRSEELKRLSSHRKKVSEGAAKPQADQPKPNKK